MNWFKKYFCDAGFWRVALRLAIPIALQNLLISSFSLIDTLMVGQLGDVALSAVIRGKRSAPIIIKFLV